MPKRVAGPCQAGSMANNVLCTEPVISLTALKRGCFVTGVSHKVLQLGMDPDAGWAGHNASHRCITLPHHRTGATRSSTGSTQQAGTRIHCAYTVQRFLMHTTPQLTQGKKGRGVSLQDLITVGMLYPGRNKLTVTYKGTTYQASLLRTGGISFQGTRHGSASSLLLRTSPSRHCSCCRANLSVSDSLFHILQASPNAGQARRRWMEIGAL